ncbi:phage portal protein [Gordonia amicalis]|uniref:Phage portal protein n=1 Tax=Gordonia amicalis TaxID=89053 RepID=A0ABU4DLL2_9ACTN|nr:phage portal protein [Gordonia amicalis]MDV6309916.1 phage portal protein [Gordonia amicalis]
MTGLPAANTSWPPAPHDLVIDACKEAQAWWTGDPALLQQFYGGGQTAAYDTTSARRNTLGNRARRAIDAFWGRVPTTTNTPKKLHVPVAADLGRIAAHTLLSEPVTFTPADDEIDALGALCDDVLNTDDNYSRMLVAAESASMLSGVYGRIVWDASVDDHTWIDYVDADRAIPEFKWGRLVGCTFWTELDSGNSNIVLRHVEYYGKGFIEHALYEGTRDNIGRPVPLNEHSATEHLASMVSPESRIVVDGVDDLLVGYFPNMRPNPLWRNEPELRHLGRSDLTVDVIRLLDAIDETWSSWMRDLELGKARIIVSESLLTPRGPGKGTTFDTDHAIFSSVAGTFVKDGEEQQLIEAHQFAIRVDEHRATAEALLRQVLGRVGYSPITFGLSDEVAATATEVGAKERDTNRTRDAKIRLWSGLSRLATTQLRVEAAIFKGPAPSEPIRVEWPDTSQATPRELAETSQLLKAAQAASTKTLVQMNHPDWDDAQVDAEVALIQGETAPPVSIFGPSESSFGAPAAEETQAEDVDAEVDGEPTDTPTA